MAADQVTITKHTLGHIDFLHLDWVNYYSYTTICDWILVKLHFKVELVLKS